MKKSTSDSILPTDSVELEGANKTSKVQPPGDEKLQKSKSSYAGHITRTINKIENLDRENVNNTSVIKCLVEQLFKLLEKFNKVCYSLIDIYDDPSKVDKVNDEILHQTQRVNDLYSELDEYFRNRDESQKSLKSQSFSKSSNKSQVHLSRISSDIISKSSLSRKSTNSYKTDVSKSSRDSLNSEVRESYDRKIQLLKQKKEIEFQLEKEKLYSKMLKQENKTNKSVSEKSRSTLTLQTSNKSHLKEENVKKMQKLNSLELTHRYLQDIENNKNESIDAFIDELENGVEVTIREQMNDDLTVASAVKQDLESRHLPKIPLQNFYGDPKFWPEFISNFKERVHNKASFNNTIRMEHLVGAVKGDAKKAIESIGTQGIFYATALKILKRDFGNPVIVSYLKLKDVIDQPPIKQNNRVLLRQYQQQLECCITWLKQMNYSEALKLQENVAKAVKRLPRYLRQKFYKHITDDIINVNYQPTLETFEKWLKANIRQLFNPIADIIEIEEKAKEPPKNLSPPYIRTNHISDVKITCWLCKENHKLPSCEQFIKKSIDEKKKFARENNLCWNCLAKGHRIADCQSKNVCRVEHCNKKHHTLLHENKTSTNNIEIENSTENNSINTNKNANRSKTYLQILPVTISYNGKSIKTNALLDAGADSTLIQENIAKKLNMKGEQISLNIENAVLRSQKIQSKIVNFEISSKSCLNEIKIKNAWVVPSLSIRTQNYDIEEVKETYPHLKDVPLSNINDGEVTVLIGADHPDLIIHHEFYSGEPDQPYGVRTKLGWVLMGGKNRSGMSRNNHISSFNEMFDLENMWKIENYPTINKDNRILMTKDEKSALSILENKTKLVNDNQYETSLLWKQDFVTLPSNKLLAENRQTSLERKFSKNPTMREQYNKVLQDYIENDYIEKIDENEIADKNNQDLVNYIPHFGVIHPKKPGKIRPVFDASAKHQNTCLNDYLYKGPDYLNNLVTILFRFRNGKYCVTSDIEKMFYQIRVPEVDRNVLRFLWRFDVNKPLDTYVFKVHAFGKIDSPSVANFALRKCAKDQEELFDKNVIQSVTENFYMDDFIKASSDKDELIKISNQLIKMLSNRHFRLTKWITNDPNIAESLPQTELSPKMLDLTSDTKEMILGILWAILNDELSICIHRTEFSNTKRDVLSCIASIFDPLGMIAPCLLDIKLLLQELWKRKIDWDDEIPPDLKENWLNFKENITEMQNVKIIRNCFPVTENSELHVFADASKKAYGCVAYSRTKLSEGVKVNFIYGKCRLAPLNDKRLTIPKLELQAALTAARIKSKIIEEADIKFEKIFLWSDSQVVLNYIKNENKKQSVFVAHRVAEIRNRSETSQWYYVSTKFNIADICTRSVSLTKIDELSNYLNGPEILRRDEIDCINITEDASIAVHNIIHENKKSLLKWDRYTSWQKIVRILAFVIRYIHNLKLKLHKKPLNLTDHLCALELNESKKKIYELIQREHFFTDIFNLNKNKPLVNRKLLPLNPFIKDNLLLVGGRLKNIELPEEYKNPIILPKEHHVTFQIVKYFHERFHHCGREHLSSLIRETYWIINLKSVCRKVVSLCLYCKRRRINPSPQLMGNLPCSRLSLFKPAFTHTGIDYFGPIYIKQGRKTRTTTATAKRYVSLFTCLTYRAIHLELVNDMSTDSFIMAVKRFISRRGKPTNIYSDNGLNFVGANNELKKLVKSLNKSDIENEFSMFNITWHFIPPSSPWMGGSWEALVKVVKRSLKTITNTHPVYEEQLRTILVEVESAVNSRPLTSVSADVNDINALTPNHFLTGRSVNYQHFEKESEFQVNSKKRWKAVEAILHIYWKRFKTEYLLSLNHRKKWNKTARNFRVGDIVLLQTDTLARSHWPLGRVLEIYAGKDKLVRTVKLKLPNCTLVRPANKLCLLEESD